MTSLANTSRPALPAANAIRRGTILIVTMWIIIALVGLVLGLAQTMRVEAQCSANSLSAAQAQAIQQGAIQYVLAHVDSLDGAMPDEEGMPAEAVRLGGGAFWVIRAGDDSLTQAYGVQDEAGKINLNTADAATLEKLPEMTAELAASIIDWRDGNSDVTPGGAESQYYLLQPDPYECKNGPLESPGELMLVKDMTGALLVGEDANRNGVLDDNENDADQSEPADDRDGELDPGLEALTTVRSTDPNTDSSGQPRVNVSQATRQEMTALLTRAGLSGQALEQALTRVQQRRPYRNAIDFYARSGLTIEQFRLIADAVTTSTDQTRRGLVNINTASRQVLACLPGLEEADADALVAWRESSGHDLSSIAWLAEALPSAKAVDVAGSVTTRTYQFSADIVAVCGDGRAFRRCRVQIDASASPPRVVSWEDLTGLGWPLDGQILSSLRQGSSLDDVLADIRPGVF